MTETDSGPFERLLQCGAAAALIILFGAVTATAQNAEPGPAEFKTAPVAPGQALPRLRRGPDGKIIAVPESEAESERTSPSQMPAERPYSRGVDPSAPDRRPAERLPSDHPLRALMDQFEVMKRDLDRLVQREQFEIDRIGREERLRNPAGPTSSPANLGPRDRDKLERLKQRDREVHDRTAQQFQLGKPYSLAPEYFMVRGPDGRRYAIAGLVRFDPGRSDTASPEMIRRLEIIKRASLVHHRPSESEVRVLAEIDRAIAFYRARL